MSEAILDSRVASRRIAFDLLYDAVGRSATLRRVWREAYGDEYPEGVEPLSYVTAAQLAAMTRALALDSATSFLDLGCGRGGPGLFVARESGASVVGVDLSPVAVREATRRAAEAGLGARSRYLVGTVEATGLPAGSLDGAISVDVLQVAPDPAAALAEVARVLVPRARFAFTSWEADPRDGDVPAHVAARAMRDYRPPLERAGFRVEDYEHPAAGLEPQLAVYRGILDNREALRAELGPAYDILAEEAEHDPEWLRRGRVRRVFVIAERR